MKIGLIDVDSHKFPNLALMKISGYHKERGDTVEWWNGLMHYDIVYKAKVFDSSYTADEEHCIMADLVLQGGTGYDIQNTLPDYVEHHKPDYSIYGIENTAYGFLTRGCPRHCGFCIVGDKEGLVAHKVADLGEFYSGQKEIVLLDPNITAAKECNSLFKQLAKTGAVVEFNQGLDIRYMNEDKVHLLNAIRAKTIHFAWDNYEMRTYEKFKKLGDLFKMRKKDIFVYVLTNYNTTHEQDLERVYKLRELGFAPYIMIYDKPHSPKITRQLQRYVNNRFIFWTVDSFEDYQAGGKIYATESTQL